MQTPESSYFPLTKGAILMMALTMAFILSLLITYLWYDLQLEQIQQAVEQIPNS